MWMGNEINFFLDFFQFFLSQMIKKWSNLYSNGQIYIQTIKFKFKRTNQKLSTYYRPPTPVSDGSTGSTARTLPPDPAPMRTVPPDSNGRYSYRSVPLPHLSGRVVPPDHRTIALRRWTLPSVTGISLRNTMFKGPWFSKEKYSHRNRSYSTLWNGGLRCKNFGGIIPLQLISEGKHREKSIQSNLFLPPFA
jgi:hypothetical protein